MAGVSILEKGRKVTVIFFLTGNVKKNKTAKREFFLRTPSNVPAHIFLVEKKEENAKIQEKEFFSLLFLPLFSFFLKSMTKVF